VAYTGEHPDCWSVIPSIGRLEERMTCRLGINKYGEILVSAAIAVVFWVGSAVPASADPDPGRTDPNPFRRLGCSCQEKYPARSPEQREEIDRGIRDGLSAGSPRGNQRASPIDRGK
jgi:hypothetical protein